MDGEELIEYADSGFRAGLLDEPSVLLVERPDAVPRLNVVLPHYSASMAYGGIVSALELARAASAHYSQVRFVSQRPWAMTTDPVELGAYVADPAGTLIETADFAPRAGEASGLVCHQRDIFFCTFWTTVLVWEAHAAALLATGRRPNPFYYFIQDFEPGFYPLSYKYYRAVQTYAHAEAYAIYNSRELAAFFRGQGYGFGREAVLMPSLNPALHAHLASQRFRLATKPTDRVVILVYGRPAQARNCFPEILEGLYCFFSALPPSERARFMVVSAGAAAPHADIRLFPELLVKCAGKLPIEKYIAYLGFAHIGISLMASPHPSYPPLEMAAFGLYTITNRFANKDLSAAHPNIRSIDAPWPRTLAAALHAAVAWLATPTASARRAVLPTNMSPLPWRENVAALKIEMIGG